MKILLVGIKTNPQVDRITEEAQKRGHSVDAVLSSELVIHASRDSFEATIRGERFEQYDLIYLWAVSSKRWDWYTAMLWLTRNNPRIRIINSKVLDPNYLYFLSSSSDYLKQTDAHILYPKSSVFFNKKSLDSALTGFEFPLILKYSPSRQGKSVYKCESREDIEHVIEETKDIAENYILREFIPNDGDIRVFTIGYKAIGAMKRTPKEGDFKSNISQGGSGAEFDLGSNQKIQEIAEKMSELTRTEIAGVDVMIHNETGEPYILEVNPGPQFLGLEEFTSVNAAGEIVSYFEKVAQAGE